MVDKYESDKLDIKEVKSALFAFINIIAFSVLLYFILNIGS